MPAVRRDEHQIADANIADLVADQTLATAAMNHHGMDVVVALERGMTAHANFKIAPFAAEFCIGK